jgi:glucose-6-phosphate dehydrogenase assembly protein OpcA
MSPVNKPETLQAWHAEDVTMREVLDALSEIRGKFAREEVDADEQPRPRTCVMTLVVVAPSEGDERLAQRVAEAIGTQHPALTVVVREDAPLQGRHLDAWINTAIRRSETAGPIECEIITLHVRGAAADHLGALVDPLLVSGVPTYLWWLGTPPFRKHELLDALRVSDGLVVDSARFDEPHKSFPGFARLLKVAHQRQGLGDFQWSRLGPWREQIAQFFSPLDRRHFLGGISEVGIDYAGEGRGNRIAAALITGWMASALRWHLKRAAAGPGGVVVAHYDAYPRAIEVQYRSVDKAHLAAGELSAVRIAGVSQGTTFRVSVQHDPERGHFAPGPAYRSLHPTGGEDDAGLELAERRAEWHRDVLHENFESLHHTATGDAPGESRPSQPVVFSYERRRPDSARVLLTVIEVGDAAPLRHVQQLDPEDDAALLLDLLSTGTHDEVFNRSLSAASELVNKF